MTAWHRQAAASVRTARPAAPGQGKALTAALREAEAFDLKRSPVTASGPERVSALTSDPASIDRGSEAPSGFPAESGTADRRGRAARPDQKGKAGSKGKRQKDPGRQPPRKGGSKTGERGRICFRVLPDLFSLLFPPLFYGLLFLFCRLPIRPHSGWYSQLFKPAFCLPEPGFRALWAGMLAFLALSLTLAMRKKCGLRLILEYLIQAAGIFLFVLFFFAFKSLFAPFAVSLLLSLQCAVLIGRLRGVSGPAAAVLSLCFVGLLYCLTVIYSVLLLN